MHTKIFKNECLTMGKTKKHIFNVNSKGFKNFSKRHLLYSQPLPSPLCPYSVKILVVKIIS